MASESSNEKRDGDRAGAALRLKLKYPDVDTFVEKFSTNISKGGVFIASRTPKPVGTPLRFELTLENGQRLIKGEGTVSWVKEFDPKQPTKAHGMGLKFSKLDSESRVLVDRMLALKQKRDDARAGGESGAVQVAVPAELTPVMAQPELRRPAGAKPPPLPPKAPPPPPRSDFEGDDATRADATPMTIMMDVGTSGVAVRREPPPLPKPSTPAPPPLSSAQHAAISITGAWGAASPSSAVPPPLPPPLAAKTNGSHAEHLDLDEALNDETTMPVATPPVFVPPVASAPTLLPTPVPPPAPEVAPTTPFVPPMPTVIVAGDVEALLAHADAELAALSAEPHELAAVLERARKLAEGVDLDTLLTSD